VSGWPVSTAEAVGVAADLLGDRVHAATRVRSGKRSLVLRLATARTGVLYAKYGADLGGEAERLAWLRDHLPVPETVAYARCDGRGEALITRALAGEDLTAGAHLARPHETVRRLADALRRFHTVGAIHGDFCLPNVLYAGADLAGYVDVGRSGPGDPAVDVAAAATSVTLNLGRVWARRFLDSIGWPRADDSTLDELIDRYERW
jgi:aminoglycoside phosphotransferase